MTFVVEEVIEDGSWSPAGSYPLGPNGAAPEILLGAGRYRLRLTGNYVAGMETLIVVRSGQETRIEIPLRKAPERFLRVFGTGLPREATTVHVRLYDREGALVHERTFGRLRNREDTIGSVFLLLGTYEVELTPEGKEPVRKTITVEAGDGVDIHSPIDIELR